jgi:hypothetical protein
VSDVLRCRSWTVHERFRNKSQRNLFKILQNHNLLTQNLLSVIMIAMESSLSNRKFTLRHVAATKSLNRFIPLNEWKVAVDASLRVVNVDGVSSDEVTWNETLRTLTWSNRSAEPSKILAGAL